MTGSVKQSMMPRELLDCFVANAPRNDVLSALSAHLAKTLRPMFN
jgi:hypothetical protein